MTTTSPYDVPQNPFAGMGLQSSGVGSNTAPAVYQLPQVHAGSWGGLPDLGITESLKGQTLGTSTNIPSTYNITPTPQAQQPASLGGGGDLVQALIAKGYNPVDAQNAANGPNAANLRNEYLGGGGGTPPAPTYNIRGTGVNAPTPQAALNQALPNNDFAKYASEFNNDPTAFLASIDQQYGQQDQMLSQQESALKAAQDQFGKTIEADYSTGLSKAGASKQKAESSLQQNTIAAEQRRQDALNAARKLYQEMQMGFRQRFGGATSAGEAAQTILGTEQQRQAGSIGRDYQNTVSQIQAQKVDLENNYQTMLQDLAGQKQRSLAELQNNFMNSLNQINANRTQSIAAREEAKRGVLLQMRNEAFAIAQQAKANEQQLNLMKQQAQIQLDTQLKLIAANAAKGSSLVDQFGAKTQTVSALSPAGTIATVNTPTSAYTPNALNTAVGQITPTGPRDPLWSNIG